VTTTTVTACLVIAAALVGCGGGSTSGTPAPSRGELTAEEIMTVSASNLYDVVRIRRSEWLRRSATRPTAFRGGQSAEVVVYLDGHRFGDAESLRQITPASVRTARFLTPSEAEMLYGLNLLGGVIDVVSQGTSGRRP
jgi:hypothetical protein